MKKYLKLSLFTFFIFIFGILNVSAEENVELIKVELQEKSEYVEINEEVSLDGNKIISNVNFFEEGDYVIYKFAIKNNDDRDYKISDIFDNNESEYLDFQYTYDEFIGAKEEKEVLLKITYKAKLPYDAVLTPENEFNAVNEISVSIELEEIIVNPDTFDNVSLYLILEIIGVIALLVIFIKLKKKNAVLLLILAMILIPKNTNAKIDFKINFTFKNTMNLKINYLDKDWKWKVPNTYSKLEFTKTNSFPEGAIDVSQEQDETIMAWIEEETLYIGSRYKIFFPVDSTDLFRTNQIQSIEFNDRIDTTFVTNMRYMFNSNPYITKLDLSSFRTGNVTNMSAMLQYLYSLKELKGLDTWDTSNLTNISYMFYGCGKNAYGANYSLDLTGWDVSNVTNASECFVEFGYVVDSIDLNISNWNLSGITSFYGFTNFGYAAKSINLNMENFAIPNVENLINNFKNLGYAAKKIYLNLTNADFSGATGAYSAFANIGCGSDELIIEAPGVNLSSLESVSYMFDQLGIGTTKYNVNLQNWIFPLLTSTEMMFSHNGCNGKEFILDLRGWDTSNITNMRYMFYYSAVSADEPKILGLGDFDLSNVETIEAMFSEFGFNAKKINFDLSNWNVSNVNNFSKLFFQTNRFSPEEWSLGDLSNWVIKDGADLSYMFRFGGNSGTTLYDFGTINIGENNTKYMFYGFNSAKGIVNIRKNPTEYNYMFENAAITNGSEIIVNYTADVTKIDPIIATKYNSSSNVIKGELIE